MDIPLRLLIIEDSDRDVALEVRALEAAGYRVTYAVADTAAEMKAALAEQAFDIVISDHDLPQFDAPGALAVLKESGLDIPFIIVSGAIGEETAVALMKAGAHDYVMKDRLSRLAIAVEHALKDAESLKSRKQAEEALKETMADLERSNKDLEQFAYVASHDLQEPLRMVASYTQLIAKRYKDKLDADANEFIGFAVDGARRMQKMIDDLLSYSRVGTRGKPFETVDWTAILNQVFTNLKLAIEETGAVITHDPLPMVRGDDSQLIQLFQNLIGNAIKFRGEEAPHIHISANHDYERRWRWRREMAELNSEIRNLQISN